MRRLMAFALLAMLAGASFAGQYTASFLPEPAPYPPSLEGIEAGRFGDYSVMYGKQNPFPYVSVLGPDASTGTLSLELARLQNESLLNSSCDPFELVGANGTDFLCTPSGWAACPEGSPCALPQAAPAPAMPLEKGAAESMFVTQAPAADAAGGARNAASPEEQGIGLTQILQVAGVVLAIVVASYLILQQRQMQIQVNPQEEKLLENETRAGIMSELSDADRIPTDLSHKLGKSKATIVEHLEALSNAGFVERVATPGKKYVFYRLTHKGKQAVLRRAG